MKKAGFLLSLLAAVSAAVSAAIGIFYADGGAMRTVQNIYGQSVVLYGNGIYADNSLLKVGATKGADVVVLLACILLLTLLFAFRRKRGVLLLRTGLLCIILYASTCLIMGVTFNRLFLLYLLQFSSSLFAFILSLHQIASTEVYDQSLYQRRLTGTGLFLMLSGCSVLVWLSLILPAVLANQPLSIADIYTTEPTFVIDLGIILPSAITCGVMLLRKKPLGYKFAPIILILLAGVGMCIIFQSAFQAALGVVLPLGQLLGMGASFIILGVFAVMLTLRLLRYTMVETAQTTDQTVDRTFDPATEQTIDQVADQAAILTDSQGTEPPETDHSTDG